VVATAAGGGYDLYGRLTAEYMQRYLPGSTFVVKNMPGAGHLIGANFIGSARPDGLTMGTFNTGLIYSQLAQIDGLRIDLTKMSWIGKAGTDPRAIVMAAHTPYKSLDEIRTSTENLKWNGAGVGTSAYMELKLLIDGLKLPGKIITGYKGNEDWFAMRRREIDGTVGSLSSYQEFVDNNYGRFIAQIGGTSDKIPQLRDLVANESTEVRAIVALIQSQGEISRLTAGPPRIPAERLAVLVGAYKQALDDPELRDKAEKAGRPRRAGLWRRGSRHGEGGAQPAAE
jgi:tripartite-type tricarboxylate transporter receptor subunit TctC